MKKNNFSIILTLSILIIILISACGSAGLASPTGLTAAEADRDNPNRVQLSWLQVPGADIYYVYRDTTEDGTFSTNAGFSVTSAADDEGELRYYFMETFDEGEGGTYWYGVTAAGNSDISVESAMSAAVSASTYSGTWSAADATIIGSAAQLSLSASTSALYAVYGSTAISVKKYAEDETSEEDTPPDIWTSLTGSPGNAAAGLNAAPAFSSLISGGELYVAFADSDETGKVSMKYYHDSGTTDVPSFAWTAAGAAGFNDAAATNIALSTAGGFSQDIYSAFLEAGVIQLYKYNSTTEGWFVSDISADVLNVSTTLTTLSHNNNLYLGYEDTVSSGIYVRAYDDNVTALQAGGLVTASNIVDGNAVFVSGGGDLYAVYLTVGGSLSVKKLVAATWTDLDDVNSDIPPMASDASPYGTLDAHFFNGFLYIFYIDSSDGKGYVKYYSEADGWQNAQRVGGGALTESSTGLGSFQLASAGTKLYAGYIEDGKGYVRILE
ncbi:MAG: hypothetical protein JEZ04_03990 [Spirochaetales bacterium]|nr:hypothetical protein [Spirochaetales bacterium]